MITNYQVSGITCGHCVNAIKTEIGAIPGVTQVDLDTDGALAIHSGATIDFSQIEAALAEAGDEYSATAS
jgi:copper chaperone CopZ